VENADMAKKTPLKLSGLLQKYQSPDEELDAAVASMPQLKDRKPDDLDD
jgi:hypothetical protein